MDGSEIYLGLLSGSNTTVEQLHKEIITVISLDIVLRFIQSSQTYLYI